MDMDNVSEKHPKIISDAISDARGRLEENGIDFLVWGCFVFLAPLCQYALAHSDFFMYQYLVYFTALPIGIVLTTIGILKKRRSPRKTAGLIEKALIAVWTLITINIFLISFVFFWKVDHLIVPIVLCYAGIGLVMSGVLTREMYSFIGGILINILGVVAFIVSPLMSLFCMAIAGLLGMITPGVLIFLNHRKNHV